MAFWMHDTLAFYILKTMKPLYKVLILICIVLVVSIILCLLFVRPLQRKLLNENKQHATLLAHKSKLEKVLAPHIHKPHTLQDPGNTQPISNAEYFSSAHHCTHFFIGACTRHRLICHEVKTQSALTKQKNNKCFIHANINGSFTDFNALLKQIKENKAIKIKTLAMKNTLNGIEAQCHLRFSLLSERQLV